MTTSDLPEDLRATSGEMRAEWRDDQEGATRDAYEQWRHGRSFADTLTELTTRGDAVSVTFSNATFRGPVAEIGPDRFAIAAPVGLVDVSFDAGLILGVDPGHGAGEPPAQGGTMRSRLLEHETAGATVIVGVGNLEVRGTVEVGTDHVLVDQSGVQRIVAISAITWLRADEPGGGR